jgi:hypothetical protein
MTELSLNIYRRTTLSIFHLFGILNAFSDILKKHVQKCCFTVHHNISELLFEAKIYHISKIQQQNRRFDTSNTNTRPLTFLAWYRHINEKMMG